MLLTTLRCAAVALSIAQATPGPVAPDSPTARIERRVAITFDDLPVVSRGFRTSEDHERITARLLATIGRHRIPAIGFVNERKLYRDSVLDVREVGVLRQWVAAGLELGNHTFSHMDLHTSALPAFLQDLVRGDSVTRSLMAEVGRTPRYFRHPYLHTGRTLQARAAVDSVLAVRRYRVAPVTVDNSDYLFAAAYDAALARGDSADAKRVGDAYVKYMERMFDFYERQSLAIAGREIPQVLLVHANVLNSDRFDAVATMLAGRGYRFASLDEVLADPIYGSKDTFVGAGGITWLHRWAITRGMPSSVFAGEPEVPADIATAAERAPRP